MFNLGDDVEHASLKTNIDANYPIAPPFNVGELDGQVITPAQVLVEEMAMTSKGNDDE
jgi:hypothetical protein